MPTEEHKRLAKMVTKAALQEEVESLTRRLVQMVERAAAANRETEHILQVLEKITGKRWSALREEYPYDVQEGSVGSRELAAGVGCEPCPIIFQPSGLRCMFKLGHSGNCIPKGTSYELTSELCSGCGAEIEQGDFHACQGQPT